MQLEDCAQSSRAVRASFNEASGPPYATLALPSVRRMDSYAFNEAAPYATAFPGDQFRTSTSRRVRESSARAVLIEAYRE